MTFEREIPVAVETPRPNARFLGVFALIGLYVGVIPVALGLLVVSADEPHRPQRAAVPAGADGRVCSPTCSSTRRTTGSKRRRRSRLVAGAGALRVRRPRGVPRRSTWSAPGSVATGACAGAGASVTGWILAVLIAIGIGLHNFGEGLAIGSAFALGELALGTLLIVGFTLHNTTEGLAIVAPLAKRPAEAASRPRTVGAARPDRRRADHSRRLARRVRLVAGARASCSLRSASARIAQVTRQIVMQSAGERGVGAYLREGVVVAGLAAGVAVMYVTGLIVG